MKRAEYFAPVLPRDLGVSGYLTEGAAAREYCHLGMPALRVVRGAGP
jgi:hypothetical protein